MLSNSLLLVLMSWLLLPLVYSCQTTKPMNSTTADYKNVIYPFLLNIEKEIASKLINKTCKTKHDYACKENNERSSIHEMVCSHLLKIAKEGDLKKLVEYIESSLGCYCDTEDYNTHFDRCRKKTYCKRRFCRASQVVGSIRSCYSALTEKYS